LLAVKLVYIPSYRVHPFKVETARLTLTFLPPSSNKHKYVASTPSLFCTFKILYTPSFSSFTPSWSSCNVVVAARGDARVEEVAMGWGGTAREGVRGREDMAEEGVADFLLALLGLTSNSREKVERERERGGREARERRGDGLGFTSSFDGDRGGDILGRR
jgi:hypothetical protein